MSAIYQLLKEKNQLILKDFEDTSSFLVSLMAATLLVKLSHHLHVTVSILHNHSFYYQLLHHFSLFIMSLNKFFSQLLHYL